MALSHSDTQAAAALNTLLDAANTGSSAATPTMTFRTGADPGANTATDTGTLLATILLSTTAFAAAASRAKALSGTPLSATAVASGTVAHFRILDRQATPNVIQCGTVSTSGADVNFSSTAWLSGGTVTVTSYSVTAFA